MSSWWQFQQMNRGKVGKLKVKPTSHWEKVDRQYWKNCGVNNDRNWQLCRSLVHLQHALVAAGKCKDGNMILVGELYRDLYNSRYVQTERKYYRCPYHEDLLENYEAFVEELTSFEDGIKRFSITNIMLPTSPFFSTSIMPILNQNITTITSLEIENGHLQSDDIELVSKFIKKNKLLGVLNLSRNDLFGIDDCVAANQLSKAMKKHPELSYVNLSNTSLGVNNEALKLILEGSKGINSLIIDNNALDKDGIALVTDYLVKKNSITEFGMGGNSIGEGEDGKANVKVLRDALQKNTTLDRLCLGSNDLGSNDRIFSTVMSGIKGSVSLTHVDLSGNNIRLMPTVKLVAKYLAKNSSLIELNLNDNGMPARCANILAQALKKNTTLQHLYLQDNNITDKSVESFTDMLLNNSTLKSLDLQRNNIKIQTGRKGLLKALCDATSLDTITNGSNHTCNLIIAGRNYGGTNEDELNNINALENEGEKIRYKVVLALRVLNKDLFDHRSFDDIPLELMPNILELVQKEIGCNGYGEGIAKSVKKRSKINHLAKLYETIHQWPAFPSLFARGPGKASLTKTGKLKRKREEVKRVQKLADEDEDFVPNGFRKTKRQTWKRTEEGWRYVEPEPVAPKRSSSSRSTATVSYADVENSDDES